MGQKYQNLYIDAAKINYVYQIITKIFPFKIENNNYLPKPPGILLQPLN